MRLFRKHATNPVGAKSNVDFTLGAQRMPHSAALPGSHPARGMTNIEVRNAAAESTAPAGPSGTIRELKVR